MKQPIDWYDEDDNEEIEENLDFEDLSHTLIPFIKKGKQERSKPKSKTKSKPKGKQPAQCPECNKMFTQAGQMKLHQKSIHQGIRFQCSYCATSATTKSNLNKHVKICHPTLSEKFSNFKAC